VSIGRLFIALVIPAIILGIAFSITCYFISKRRGLGRKGQKYAPGERFRLFLGAAPALVIPLAVIGGIYGGVFTPTEAGAIGVVAAAVLGGTVYRSKERSFLAAIKESLLEASILASIIMLIISVSSAFAYFFSITQMPQLIASTLFGISLNPIIILLLFNLIMIVLGMFLDTLGLIIMMAPVIRALFIPLDISLLYVGVLMVMNSSVGQISPPVGGNLYVACGVANVSLEDISKQIIPFILVVMGVLALLIVFPQIVVLM
jgi:C4-dicarboxylate transporter DctM subunit